QADFSLLLRGEDGGQSCTALQRNRDNMTQITRLAVTGEEVGTYTGQLALAHTHGSGGEDSCENTVKAVSGLLYGVEIDHYMSMTMDAVAVVNDLAGGVTLTVLSDMTSVDPDWTQGAQITLMGEQALLYVRS
ncbi:MAG: LCP family protein, partial [Oscillospiraceae bacterium]|nr:LCP family protein [Oscillospiraceae bacterium]